MRDTVYNITVESVRVQYKLIVSRKITIIRGDSGTGKTALLEFINASKRYGSKIVVKSKLPLIPILNSRNWIRDLEEIDNSIIFLDEEFDGLKSPEFAKVVKNSNNYFVIITRDVLTNLPYSIHEIYEMKNSGKFIEMVPLYIGDKYGEVGIKPELIITEDSKSGYHFFLEVCNKNIDLCISAKGKSNISHLLRSELINHKEGQNILIVADGAAFGNEIKEVCKLIDKLKDKINILLYLPESFEQILLKSPMILENCDNPELISYPEIYDREYFSRELYFEKLLKEITENTPARYIKNKLSTCFTKRCCHLLGSRNCHDIPCKLENNKCKTDLDKINSILEWTGIDFSNILLESSENCSSEKIKSFW